MKRENTLECDVKAVAGVVARMASAGYRPFCLIVKLEDIEETVFLETICFYRYATVNLNKTVSHDYYTVLLESPEGSRAVCFVNHDADLTRAYQEGERLKVGIATVGAFFWLLGNYLYVPTMAERICYPLSRCYTLASRYQRKMANKAGL